MQNLRRVLIGCSLALAVTTTWLVGVEFSQSRPIRVSYHDLQPEARKEVDCLADNVYFEARGETYEGQKAVALVTMNRVYSKNFSDTVCGVVKQKENATCQFSWWCDAKFKAQALRRATDRQLYDQALMIALEIYLNYERIHDITKGALFYHADYVPKTTIGVPNLRMTVKIGQHVFYRT